MSRLRLTVLFEPVEEGWVQARVAELPEVITVARTRDEAREMVVDALTEYLSVAGGDPTEGQSGDSEELMLELSLPI